MSGDEVMVEMATHHAGDDYEKMVKGDAGMEDVFMWTQSKMNVPFRGRTGECFGCLGTYYITASNWTVH